MGDFGHSYASLGNTHIDCWGKGPLVLRYKGKTWRFEHSDMFGPYLLTASDEIASQQPIKETHPFWEAFYVWFRGGKRHRPVYSKRGKFRFYLCSCRKEAATNDALPQPKVGAARGAIDTAKTQGT